MDSDYTWLPYYRKLRKNSCSPFMMGYLNNSKCDYNPAVLMSRVRPNEFNRMYLCVDMHKIIRDFSNNEPADCTILIH